MMKNRVSYFAKAVAVLINLCFILPHISWAFDAAIYPAAPLLSSPIPYANKIISIPGKLGTITDGYQGQDKTVVLISDLHCNYEVQKNIAAIIKRLANKRHVKLVGEEGAFGKVDLDVLRDFPLEKIRSAIADYYVKQGKLTGAEYYAATAPKAIVLEGIEDPRLYNDSYALIRSFLNAESQGYCYDLRDSLNALKSKLYNKALLKVDAEKEAFRQGRTPLLSYALYLDGQARRLRILAGAYPNLSRYINAKQDHFAPELNPENLYQEIEELDQAIRGHLYTNDDQKQLDLLLGRLDIIEKLLNISVTQEELARFRHHRQAFKVQAFITFIDRVGTENFSPLLDDSEITMLDGKLNQVEQFYQLADERSEAFVDTILHQMKARNEKMAVMINGGFHTGKVKAVLKQKNISYISIRPTLIRRDTVNPYFDLLQGKKLPIEKLLEKNQSIFATLSWPMQPDFKNSMLVQTLPLDVAESANVGGKAKDVLLGYFKDYSATYHVQVKDVDVTELRGWHFGVSGSQVHQVSFEEIGHDGSRREKQIFVMVIGNHRIPFRDQENIEQQVGICRQYDNTLVIGTSDPHQLRLAAKLINENVGSGWRRFYRWITSVRSFLQETFANHYSGLALSPTGELTMMMAMPPDEGESVGTSQSGSGEPSRRSEPEEIGQEKAPEIIYYQDGAKIDTAEHTFAHSQAWAPDDPHSDTSQISTMRFQPGATRMLVTPMKKGMGALSIYKRSMGNTGQWVKNKAREIIVKKSSEIRAGFTSFMDHVRRMIHDVEDTDREFFTMFDNSNTFANPTVRVPTVEEIQAIKEALLLTKSSFAQQAALADHPILTSVFLYHRVRAAAKFSGYDLSDSKSKWITRRLEEGIYAGIMTAALWPLMSMLAGGAVTLAAVLSGLGWAALGVLGVAGVMAALHWSQVFDKDTGEPRPAKRSERIKVGLQFAQMAGVFTVAVLSVGSIGLLFTDPNHLWGPFFPGGLIGLAITAVYHEAWNRNQSMREIITKNFSPAAIWMLLAGGLTSLIIPSTFLLPAFFLTYGMAVSIFVKIYQQVNPDAAMKSIKHHANVAFYWGIGIMLTFGFTLGLSFSLVFPMLMFSALISLHYWLQKLMPAKVLKRINPKFFISIALLLTAPMIALPVFAQGKNALTVANPASLEPLALIGSTFLLVVIAVIIFRTFRENIKTSPDEKKINDSAHNERAKTAPATDAAQRIVNHLIKLTRYWGRSERPNGDMQQLMAVSQSLAEEMEIKEIIKEKVIQLDNLIDFELTTPSGKLIIRRGRPEDLVGPFARVPIIENILSVTYFPDDGQTRWYHTFIQDDFYRLPALQVIYDALGDFRSIKSLPPRKEISNEILPIIDGLKDAAEQAYEKFKKQVAAIQEKGNSRQLFLNKSKATIIPQNDEDVLLRFAFVKYFFVSQAGRKLPRSFQDRKFIKNNLSIADEDIDRARELFRQAELVVGQSLTPNLDIRKSMARTAADYLIIIYLCTQSVETVKSCIPATLLADNAMVRGESVPGTDPQSGKMLGKEALEGQRACQRLKDAGEHKLKEKTKWYLFQRLEKFLPPQLLKPENYTELKRSADIHSWLLEKIKADFPSFSDDNYLTMIRLEAARIGDDEVEVIHDNKIVLMDLGLALYRAEEGKIRLNENLDPVVIRGNAAPRETVPGIDDGDFSGITSVAGVFQAVKNIREKIPAWDLNNRPKVLSEIPEALIDAIAKLAPENASDLDKLKQLVAEMVMGVYGISYHLGIILYDAPDYDRFRANRSLFISGKMPHVSLGAVKAKKINISVTFPINSIEDAFKAVTEVRAQFMKQGFSDDDMVPGKGLVSDPIPQSVINQIAKLAENTHRVTLRRLFAAAVGRFGRPEFNYSAKQLADVLNKAPDYKEYESDPQSFIPQNPAADNPTGTVSAYESWAMKRFGIDAVTYQRYLSFIFNRWPLALLLGGTAIVSAILTGQFNVSMSAVLTIFIIYGLPDIGRFAGIYAALHKLRGRSTVSAKLYLQRQDKANQLAWVNMGLLVFVYLLHLSPAYTALALFLGWMITEFAGNMWATTLAGAPTAITRMPMKNFLHPSHAPNTPIMGETVFSDLLSRAVYGKPAQEAPEGGIDNVFGRDFNWRDLMVEKGPWWSGFGFYAEENKEDKMHPKLILRVPGWFYARQVLGKAFSTLNQWQVTSGLRSAFREWRHYLKNQARLDAMDLNTLYGEKGVWTTVQEKQAAAQAMAVREGWQDPVEVWQQTGTGKTYAASPTILIALLNQVLGIDMYSALTLDHLADEVHRRAQDDLGKAWVAYKMAAMTEAEIKALPDVQLRLMITSLQEVLKNAGPLQQKLIIENMQLTLLATPEAMAAHPLEVPGTEKTAELAAQGHVDTFELLLEPKSDAYTTLQQLLDTIDTRSLSSSKQEVVRFVREVLQTKNTAARTIGLDATHSLQLKAMLEQMTQQQKKAQVNVGENIYGFNVAYQYAGLEQHPLTTPDGRAITAMLPKFIRAFRHPANEAVLLMPANAVMPEFLPVDQKIWDYLRRNVKPHFAHTKIFADGWGEHGGITQGMAQLLAAKSGEERRDAIEVIARRFLAAATAAHHEEGIAAGILEHDLLVLSGFYQAWHAQEHFKLCEIGRYSEDDHSEPVGVPEALGMGGAYRYIHQYETAGPERFKENQEIRTRRMERQTARFFFGSAA